VGAAAEDSVSRHIRSPSAGRPQEFSRQSRQLGGVKAVTSTFLGPSRRLGAVTGQHQVLSEPEQIERRSRHVSRMAAVSRSLYVAGCLVVLVL
jgi:hypothetical protein